jgi:hypothetical protein
VYVVGDMRVSLEASREMLGGEHGSTQEQYRHPNLVIGKRRICVNPTSTFGSYSRLIAGLDLAIGNYNALPLEFDFARGPTTGCDANITAATTSGAGGSSGFPSGGNPYSIIYIGTGILSYSADAIEALITHELGHAIGLMHSDCVDGSSCGGAPQTCGIPIPGTSTGTPPDGSIMNTCLPATTNGEFSYSDITALNYIY